MIRLTLAVAITGLLAGCSPKLSPDNSWGRDRWVVTELKGVPVQQSGNRKDAFLRFSTADKKISGNAGCNQMNGSYTLETRSRIKFVDVATTKMSCPDIAFENTLLEVMRDVDRYETDGTQLRLKDGSKTVIVLTAK